MTKERQTTPKLFADTSKADEIERLIDLGLVHGITTNPIIVASQVGSENPMSYYENLARKFTGMPISIQLLDHDIPTLIMQAHEFAKISPDIVIKVPMFGDGRGLAVLHMLAQEGIKTNVTGLMRKEQLLLALLAGRCKATIGPNYVSLFFNRIRDRRDEPVFDSKIHGSGDPGEEIRESRHLIDELGFSSEIITGSIRTGADVFSAMAAGTHIVTVQPKVIWEMAKHDKTDGFIKECQEKFERATASNS